jgi:glycosyltransferase involved in cell wall biosynthesis
MSKPFFSIIIPTLNEERYLPLLLQDLVKQSFRDFEVIIVDAKSTDQTIAKATTYKKVLPSLRLMTAKRRHVSVQRNLGATKGRGDYLIFMDADNRLPLYFLEGIHYHLLVTPTDLFTTWCVADSDLPAEKTIATAVNLLVEAGKFVEFEGAMGAMIGSRSEVFRRGVKFDPKLGFAEDADFIRQNVRRGATFTIFRDPQFVYSLRRYRTSGTIKTLQQSAKLYLKQVTGLKVARREYPMGGHVFVKSKRTIRQAMHEIQAKINALLEV